MFEAEEDRRLGAGVDLHKRKFTVCAVLEPSGDSLHTSGLYRDCTTYVRACIWESFPERTCRIQDRICLGGTWQDKAVTGQFAMAAPERMPSHVDGYRIWKGDYRTFQERGKDSVHDYSDDRTF
jgi:hypothetical protein